MNNDPDNLENASEEVNEKPNEETNEKIGEEINKKTSKHELKLAKRTEKKRKKAEKKRKRKEAFLSKSKAGKVWYISWRILILLGIICLLIVFAIKAAEYAIMEQVKIYLSMTDAFGEAPIEDVLAVSPKDIEGEKKIDAIPSGDKEDTWAIYVYICGSNLESKGLNKLSEFAYTYSNAIAEDNYKAKNEANTKNLRDFLNTVSDEGLEAPSHLFRGIREEYEYYSDSYDEEEAVGAASTDINEILASKMSKNVKVIIETGGAGRWDNNYINPNFNERFIYDENGFNKLESATISNMGTKKTLENFLEFCKDYPADHQMLIMWNHGGAFQGICHDENFNEMMTLSDLRGALENAYGKNPKECPLDLIGFDACLMASNDVLEYIAGYADYLVSSEEIEAGCGWYYTPWLNKLNEEPSMSPAKLGQHIVDSFNEYYANQELMLPLLGLHTNATLSVIDVNEYKNVSKAYNDLISQALMDAGEEPSIMSFMGMASTKSIRFAKSSYEMYNLSDLGLFMEQLSEVYPDEASAVLDAMDKAVLYKRSSKEYSAVSGVSVYFPTEINSIDSMNLFLNYINGVCLHPEQKALYYYKVAGCLNDELKDYLKQNGFKNLPNIDTSAFESLPNMQLDIREDGNFSFSTMNIDELLQQYRFCLASLNEKEQTLTYYGHDNYVLSQDNILSTDYDCTWLSVGGVILPTEVIGYTTDTIQYRAPIRMNDLNYYLILSYDADTGVCDIVGLNENSGADLIGHDLVNLQEGDVFSPIYEKNSIDSSSSSFDYYDEVGPHISYRYDMPVERCVIEDGKYLAYVELMDTRSDLYSSPIVEVTVKDGQMINATQRTDLYNEKY